MNTCLQKYGVPYWSKSEKCRENNRKLRLDQVTPQIGKNETLLLNNQEKMDNCIIDRKFTISGFKPDGYCKETNTIYEIYEKYHKSPKQMIKDIQRQKIIQEKLNCNFVVIWDTFNK